MPVRTSTAKWEGGLQDGKGTMAVASILAEAGHPPQRIETSARVHLVPGDEAAITQIELSTEGEVSGIDESEFQRYAETAKAGCPVSKALAGVEISLDAHLATDGG